jgi:hypothetical protein
VFKFTSKKAMDAANGGAIKFGPPDWTRRFVVHFHFIGWDHLQLGFHLCTSLPNIELHVPSGFLRVGWIWEYKTWE